VAIGGNSLIRDSQHLAIADQYQAAVLAVHHVTDLIVAGWDVVITHGNGPQMGFIMRRSELALSEVAPVPMDYAGADLQGAIGYMLLKALHNEFHARGLTRKSVAIVTQTLVEEADPAFSDPTKPIGSHMEEAIARKRAGELGWIVKEDAGRGWRRVVPSPKPKAIIEIDVIRELAKSGYVVVACGGGGIPVIQTADGNLQGVEAVIDKDFASSLLAREIAADVLVLCTSVEKVALDFNTPKQRWLDRITVSEARRHYAADQFDRGSMGPKILALIEFIEGGGPSGLITNPANLGRGLAGATGTWIVPG
jgi:carbamate kinase